MEFACCRVLNNCPLVNQIGQVCICQHFLAPILKHLILRPFKYFMLHPLEHSAVAKLHFAGCSKCHSTNEGATTCSEETSIAAVKDKRRSQKRTSSIREPVPCVVLSCSCLRSFCLVEQPISSIIPSLRIFFFQSTIFLSSTFFCSYSCLRSSRLLE